MIGISILVILTVNLFFVFILFVRSKNKKEQFKDQFQQLDKNLERLERVVKDEIATNRDEMSKRGRESREEISLVLEKMRSTVKERLESLQADNSAKLDKMRQVVDEKLHATLERRLGESFKQVSDRLESVHKGLGEMQALALNVGDLKKVLTNVKTRGIWGEIQLGALLEQILTKDQYDINVITKKGSSERVEFAIRLPGSGKDQQSPVWLPIDAKFPQEDYQRLIESQELCDLDGFEKAAKQLETRIKSEAKDIRDKYIDPPNTVDFAILFLPVEGLYAEVLRRPGLIELLQKDFRVVVSGPTTISALLNSLQMGFRTLVIEKRTSEVWRLLGAVKHEFFKFGDILDKTKKKLLEATNTIDLASSKTRNIQGRLNRVQTLPAAGNDNEPVAAVTVDLPQED